MCFGLIVRRCANSGEYLELLCDSHRFRRRAYMFGLCLHARCGTYEHALLTASEPAGAALLQYLSATFDLDIAQGEAEYVVYPIVTNPLLTVLQATWLELEVCGTVVPVHLTEHS
jgi:hypothetical protein